MLETVNIFFFSVALTQFISRHVGFGFNNLVLYYLYRKTKVIIYTKFRVCSVKILISKKSETFIILNFNCCYLIAICNVLFLIFMLEFHFQ